MIFDQHLRQKMEISVRLLLLFFIIAFNMMKNLVETFTIKLFALINVFSKVEPPFCMIFFKTLYEVPLI